jgi:hypothetical protein
LNKLEQEAKELILEECKKHYNTGGCFTKCRCRNGKCIGTTKDNKYNTELIQILKE